MFQIAANGYPYSRMGLVGSYEVPHLFFEDNDIEEFGRERNFMTGVMLMISLCWMY